jgi:hypothetical protein
MVNHLQGEIPASSPFFNLQSILVLAQFDELEATSHVRRERRPGLRVLVPEL